MLLRQKLAAEPVVLAPAPAVPVVAPARVRSAWLAPAAAAAGLAVVAGVLVVSRLAGPAAEGGAAVMAGGASASPSGVLRVSSGAPTAAAPVLSGAVIRDPRLDEYLRAHQATRGGFVANVPGSSLRQVDAQIAGGSLR